MKRDGYRVTPFIHVAFKRMQVPVKTDCYHVTNKREIEVGQTKTLEFEVALDANTEALVLWSIQHYDYGTVSSVCLIAAKCETCRNEGGGWWRRESEGERASQRDKFHAQATSSVRMCMQTHLCTRISMHAYVYVSGHPCTGAGESGRAGDRGAGAQAAASRGNDAADRAQAHRQRRAREAGVPERSKAEPL